jgi:hypothetical protein
MFQQDEITEKISAPDRPDADAGPFGLGVEGLDFELH